MKITREIPIVIEKENKMLLEELDRLMAVFSSAIRYAFNRLLEGETKGKLIKKVNVNFHLNKRYAEDAVLFAQSIVTSQKELLPSRIENVQKKIEKTEQKKTITKQAEKRPKKHHWKFV